MKLKRLLAGLVAVAMTASMLPAVVFADEGENETKETAAIETTEPEKKETEKPAEKETEPEKKEEPAEAKLSQTGTAKRFRSVRKRTPPLSFCLRD